MTAELVSKHLPTPVVTVQSHQHQERQNLQTTKQPTQEKIDIATIKIKWNKLKELKKPGQSMSEILQADLDKDSFPVSPTPNI